MKLIARILLIACLAAFAACSDDDDNDVVIPDYKADQIYSTCTLYENIAKQPEIAVSLIQSTAKLAQYDTITDILPLNNKAEEERGISRGKCLAACFLAISRQPEAYGDIEWAAEKFLGVAETKTMSEKILQYSRLYVLSGFTEGLARQPEILGLFNKFSIKFMGTTLQD